LLATARLFDTPHRNNKTRCVKGVLKYLSDNSRRLPQIVEWSNLMSAMKDIGFSEQLLMHHEEDTQIAEIIVNHFTQLLESPEISRLLAGLKEIRDKRLAHNEFIKPNYNEINDTIDPITFKDLKKLVEIAKNFIGIVGWAYMNTVFVPNRQYRLTSDAERPKYSLEKLISTLKK
jgi:hypothetical protein